MLEVFDLQVSYGAIKALDGISFGVPQGRIVTLLGANGSGKTTALRAITGLAAPGAGALSLRGGNSGGSRPTRSSGPASPWCRRAAASSPISPSMRTCSLGAYFRRDQPALARDLDLIYATFPRLAERRTQAAGTLSGGEQQMLALGRALMSRPPCWSRRCFTSSPASTSGGLPSSWWSRTPPRP